MHPFTQELITLCRHFNLLERSMACCDGVTVPQCTALQHLLAGPVAVSALATALGTSVSATTRLIDGMYPHGWLTRTRDPNDRRRVLIDLSPEGKTKALQLQHNTDQMVLAVIDKIPEDQHDQLLASIQLIRKTLDGLS